MNSLAGRTVVITRAAEQVDDTIELVKSFEAIPIVVPLIEIVDEPAGMAQLAALDLGDADWLVVTSRNGALRVAPMLQSAPNAPRIAAVGTASAAALPRCDLIAETQSARGLLKMLPTGPGRVVVVQAVDAVRALPRNAAVSQTSRSGSATGEAPGSSSSDRQFRRAAAGAAYPVSCDAESQKP